MTRDPVVVTRSLDTPLGPMLGGVACDAPESEGDPLPREGSTGLCLLEFVERPALPRERAQLERALGAPLVPEDADAWPEGSRVLDQAAAELDAYFSGSLRDFRVPLRLPGTAWQRRVWGGLLSIPFGRTLSYGELASRLGSPDAARAVGLANGANRVAIVVPCHRVIAGDGSPHGYGGGLPRKRKLLALEAAGSGLFAGVARG